MKYVGSRYIPKFIDDPHDPNFPYEALSVVDGGMGVSYINDRPIPANQNIPLTDTDYWHIYGTTNGAIINLQNQIDAINLDITDINGMLNKHYFLDTVSDITSNNFEVGDVINVRGYYAVDDGGACTYVVSNTSNSFTIATNNNNYAFPVTDHPTPEIFGAHCDGVNDDTPYIDKAIEYVLFTSPVTLGVAPNYQDGIGGGIVYFNPKTYYAKTKLTAKLLCIKLAGVHKATMIYCTDGFVEVDYGSVSTADYLYTEPRYFQVTDITFVNMNNSAAIFSIDKPYHNKFKGCTFITDVDSRTMGYALQFSTIVNAIVDSCEFSGYNGGVNIVPYTGTYPTGYSGTNQNTTLKIMNSRFYYCNHGIRMSTPSELIYIQDLMCENCIFEGNATDGIYISTNTSTNISRLHCKDCYFENNPTAIDLGNCAIDFDQSNILNRAVGGGNKIKYGATRVNNNDAPVANYMFAYKDDDYQFNSALPTSRFFFDYIPSIYQAPTESVDSYLKIRKFKADASFVYNMVDPDKHPNVVAEIVGDDTYAVYKLAITSSTQSGTASVSDANVSVRADGALICSSECDFTIKW